MNYYEPIINENDMKNNKLKFITTIMVLVVFLFITSAKASDNQNKEILSDNLYYANLNISGLTIDQAKENINLGFQRVENTGLIFTYNQAQLLIPAVTVSFDSDLSYQNFHYNPDNLDNILKNYTRPNFLLRWWYKIIQKPATNIQPEFNLDEDRVKKAIKEAFPDSYYPATDAAFVFTKNGIKTSSEKLGKDIDWEDLFTAIYQNLNSLKIETVNIKTKTAYPEIYEDDIVGLEIEADKLSRSPLTLYFQDKEWLIDQADIASWLSVNKIGSTLSLGFNEDRVIKYLEEQLANKVNVLPQDPRFEIKDNKISSWQLGKDGYELETTASANQIITEYANDHSDLETGKRIPLTVKTLTPITADSFDIEEIIGTGHSNFAGSPANRRHNIEVGAAAVHGVLLKDGEEFSLVKVLGEIDAESGYLPELVIKNNKTIPEYGGGLCQIGTTVFRSALATGLPITARQNHSYRVSYYEPAGTDAAIYDPWPDVRFLNDTGKNLLIQSRIEGNDIYFDFWGTSDGRVATTTTPVVYNITAPPETKIIETDELAPGEKKCTEHAHNGADAYFNYIVVYPEGATSTPLEKERRFSSHYVPWQEVCLVGKEATSTPETDIASTTTPIITETPNDNTATTTIE